MATIKFSELVVVLRGPEGPISTFPVTAAFAVIEVIVLKDLTPVTVVSLPPAITSCMLCPFGPVPTTVKLTAVSFATEEMLTLLAAGKVTLPPLAKGPSIVRAPVPEG